jgi:predicted RNA polymerase sigma factor
MALTLRLVCGMSTEDIARLFLVSETTMGARITRAKQKISTARIPLRMPTESEMPDRLRAVLGVIYLLFTMGHTADVRFVADANGTRRRSDALDHGPARTDAG